MIILPGAETGTVLTPEVPAGCEPRPVTVVHHEAGDLVVAWEDGLEYDCTYLFHPEEEEHYFNKGAWELICYGKYQPRSSDKKGYVYMGSDGYSYSWKNGKWKATAFVADSCDEPTKRISSEAGEGSGTFSGTWQ